MMLEKWESVVNHDQNIHAHDGQLYTECPHGPLEGRERHKKWLKPGGKVAERVCEVVTSRQMKKDLPKLSPGDKLHPLRVTMQSSIILPPK